MGFFIKKTPTSIGLIAGEGEFPILFAEAASKKAKLFVFAIEGIADKKIERFASETHYLRLGELGKFVDLLKKTGIRSLVFAGGVPKVKIYDPSFKMDDSAKNFLKPLKDLGDDHLLKAFALFLKVRCGVSVLDARLFLDEILCPKGVLTSRQPTADEWKDLKYGKKISKGIGKMDIGQTVVVKRRNVLAVEAIEGTNKAIRRGGELGQADVVVVKTAKPGQDVRFDLPCVGLETLDTLKAVSSHVLGMEAGKTILISKDRLIEVANRENMTLVGL